MKCSTKYILKISCPDQKGLIAATTNILNLAGANVLSLKQHTSTDLERFFLRAVFDCEEGHSKKTIENHINRLAEQYQMEWSLFDSNHREQVALLVSKTTHCLYELLLEHRDGQMNCDFACIISNHLDTKEIAERNKIPFYHVPVDGSREDRETKMNKIMNDHNVTTVVLARYMQILTAEFCKHWKNHMINIHHGFLPAFKGAKPYHQAWKKGVKLIGATAHFATEDLDQGPIIWQSVVHSPDTSSIADFVQTGKDIERRTLSTAVKMYLNNQVFTYNNRTFIL